MCLIVLALNVGVPPFCARALGMCPENELWLSEHKSLFSSVDFTFKKVSFVPNLLL